jgi:hypothetical protein
MSSLPHRHPNSDILRKINVITVEVNDDTNLHELVIKIAEGYEKNKTQDFGYRVLFTKELSNKEPIFETALSNVVQEKESNSSLRKATYMHDNEHCGIFIAKPSVYQNNSISLTDTESV